MKPRAVAAAQLLLISPSVLFMTALVVRRLQPPQDEPAHTAGQIVMWYALRPHLGLWVLLMALPFAVLVIGCSMLSRGWKGDVARRQAARQTLTAIHAHRAMLVVAAATLTAGAVLTIVAVHALAN